MSKLEPGLYWQCLNPACQHRSQFCRTITVPNHFKLLPGYDRVMHHCERCYADVKLVAEQLDLPMTENQV